jgi:hypothetical protein
VSWNAIERAGTFADQSMSDVYLHLTQLAQKCAAVLGIAQADAKWFDDLFQDMLAVNSEAATDLTGLLYAYAKAYGRLANVRDLSRLKNQLSAEETQELQQLKQAADAARAALVARITELQEAGG